MKKKEIKIVVLILVIAAAMIGILQLRKNAKSAPSNTTAASSQKDDGTNSTYPSEEPVGQWVGIVHANKVEVWFDSGVNAEYTVKGDYGTMHVEVLDGRWHVSEVECPNHTCEQMGWDDGTAFTPIWCIPNNIFIATNEWVQGYFNE